MTNDSASEARGPHSDWLDQLFGTSRRLGIERPHPGRWFAGVSAGIAERYGLDPLIVRAGFILGACLFGAAVPVYLLAWMLLPDDEGHIMVERAVREGHGPSAALAIVLLVVIVNGFWVFSSWGSWGMGLGTLIVIGLLVWAVASGHLDVTGGSPRGATGERGRPSTEHSFGEQRREGWDAGRWGRTPDTHPSAGNRAAQAGATYRTPDGRIDLSKHDSDATAPERPANPWWTRPWPRRPRLGALTLLILGVAALAGAGTAMIVSGSTHADDATQLGLAAAVGVVGLGLLIGGLAGRRGGLLTFASIPIAAAAIVSLLVPTGMPWHGGVGSQTWTPTSVASGQRHDFALLTGDGTLDLGQVTAANGQKLTARVNVGDLTIIVPSDLTVHITSKVDAGTYHLPAAVLAKAGDGSNPGGIGLTRTFTVGSGPTDLSIDARVGIGDLTVRTR